MPDLTVASFRRGIDKRRQQYAAPEGSLWTCENGFVNKGGEIENRLDFVSKYTIPSGTYGLAQQSGNLYVFGSGVDPGVPVGITYQRLQHGANNMTEVLDAFLANQKLYVIASFDDGSVQHFYDGTQITDVYDGKARSSFSVTGGTANPGTNDVDSILVNGVDVLGAAIDWTTSNANTASLLAAQINSHTSSPDYSAVASGTTVVIISDTSGTGPNGHTVSVTIAAGDVTTTTPAALAGGVADSPGDPGSSGTIHKNKTHITQGAFLSFSEIDNFVEYNAPALGAGQINIASNSKGGSTPVSVDALDALLAVMCEEAIQLWFADADPELYDLKQTIGGDGSRAARSSQLHESNDLIFLGRQGIRALRARPDTVDKADIAEIGAPLDVDVKAQIDSVTAAVLADAVSVIEPNNGQYWLAIGDEVFVYSWHPSAQVAAWSIFKPGFSISDFAVVGQKTYCRTGDTVYLYGDDGFDTYAADYTTTVRIPFLDAGRPAGFKDLMGIDVGLLGEWTVSVGTSLQDTTELDEVGVIPEATYDENAIPTFGNASHIAIEATHAKAEKAIISQFVLHYERDDTDQA